MTVASAMSQTFLTVPPTATVRETVAAMLASRQWCALVVGEGGVLEGILTLADVQTEAKKAAGAVGGRLQAQMLVSHKTDLNDSDPLKCEMDTRGLFLALSIDCPLFETTDSP